MLRKDCRYTWPGRWSALVLLGSVLVLLAAGCRERPPQLRSLPENATVLAFGDSLTHGTGADANESYPFRLEQLIQRPVINAGVPGEVTADGLVRLPQLLDRHRPALLILCHGGNDLLRRIDEEQAAKNLRAMVSLARERGIDVVLIGVPKPDLSLAPPAFYARIAGEFAIPYDGDTLAGILSDRSRKSDYIHPNARGYQHLTEAVHALLQAAHAL
ncbi:MAG TPA: arylesterase [Desulfuromonadales bacterium]|nr:arylesterase [Desulfuromonadales bacterium]